MKINLETIEQYSDDYQSNRFAYIIKDENGTILSSGDPLYLVAEDALKEGREFLKKYPSGCTYITDEDRKMIRKNGVLVQFADVSFS